MHVKKITVISVFIFGVIFFNLCGEPFFQDDTSGRMKKLNYKLELDRDKAWESLSLQLQKMSSTILNTPNLKNADKVKFEELWEDSINNIAKKMDKKYRQSIEDLSEAGTKSNFNDPLFYNDIRNLKRQYDIYYFILKKMEQCQFQIYYKFWLCPMNGFFNFQQFQAFGDSDKLYYIVGLINNFLDRPNNEQNIKTIELLTTYICKFDPVGQREKYLVTYCLVETYKHVKDEKIKILIQSTLRKWHSSDTTLQMEVNQILNKNIK